MNKPDDRASGTGFITSGVLELVTGIVLLTFLNQAGFGWAMIVLGAASVVGGLAIEVVARLGGPRQG
jgi:uncharacterized membrane protein HdeD (DUF308 family)